MQIIVYFEMDIIEMSHFVLGKYRFQTKEEYETAVKELALIDKIRKEADFNSFNDIKKIYTKLSSGEIVFSSQPGRDFDDEIYERYETLKNGNVTTTDSSGKKLSSKKKPSEKTRLEDFDSDMQQQILKEMKKRERSRKIILCVCFLIMFGCVGYLIFYQYMSTRTQHELEQLADMREEYQSNTTKTSDTSSKEEDKHYYANITDDTRDGVLPEVLPLYEDLYNQNKSLIGWLKIADTIIDYPVMQAPNNEYYLDHNFHQKYDKNGSIFLDAECSVYPRSDNLILYGHHMKSGKMFGSLWKFEDKNYYLKHKHIEFDTIYETGIYEIMYVFRDRVYSKEDVNFKYYEFMNANSETEFNSYMNEMAAMSYYDTGVVAEYGDKLLTLSTCDYEQNNGRFVVVARKITNN